MEVAIRDAEPSDFITNMYSAAYSIFPGELVRTGNSNLICEQ
jgi:hypothetical protein